MRRIDLNVDIGEGFEFDDELLGFATSANVCCGAHAGSWSLTIETVRKCAERGVRVGVHPGYPERESMGRAAVSGRENLEKAMASVERQISRFGELTMPAYVKPHGALYNQSADPGEVAELLALTLQRVGLPLMGLPGTEHERLARHGFIREGFGDRAYRADGRLKPRSEEGSVLHEPEAIRAQVLHLASTVDSLCLHGDTLGCVEFARIVRAALQDAGYEVGW